MGAGLTVYVLTLLLWSGFCRGIKLRVRGHECVYENIPQPNSLVTASLVSLAPETNKAYFSFKVTDPSANLVYHREPVDEAEFAFMSRVDGKHAFCLEVHKNSHNYPHDMVRDVVLDITVGETWNHDRVRQEHLDELMENISEVSGRVQRLKSEMRLLRFREERHRETVDSTDRRVKRYALIKGVVLVCVALTQVSVIQYFFRSQSP